MYEIILNKNDCKCSSMIIHVLFQNGVYFRRTSFKLYCNNIKYQITAVSVSDRIRISVLENCKLQIKGECFLKSIDYGHVQYRQSEVSSAARRARQGRKSQHRERHDPNHVRHYYWRQEEECKKSTFKRLVNFENGKPIGSFNLGAIKFHKNLFTILCMSFFFWSKIEASRNWKEQTHPSPWWSGRKVQYRTWKVVWRRVSWRHWLWHRSGRWTTTWRVWFNRYTTGLDSLMGQTQSVSHLSATTCHVAFSTISRWMEHFLDFHS